MSWYLVKQTLFYVSFKKAKKWHAVGIKSSGLITESGVLVSHCSRSLRGFVTIYKTDFLLSVNLGDFSVTLCANYKNVLPHIIFGNYICDACEESGKL
jgi:hypothetical protein